MTSRPLFIRVAESMVILAPMSQLGWRRAWAGVMWRSSSLVLPKKGPPEAVRISFFKAPFSGQPWRHWKMAECSLSTGRMLTLFCLAASMTIRPPATRVSLLARATVFLAAMAARVGRRPTMPTTELRVTSTPSQAAAWQRPSMPSNTVRSRSRVRSRKSLAAAGSNTATAWGRNSRACSSRSLTLERAAKTATETGKSPPRASSRTTCKVCMPMEPVDPSRASFTALPPL